jgi:hypothetical protein
MSVGRAGLEPALSSSCPGCLFLGYRPSDPSVCASSSVLELSVRGVVDGSSVRRLRCAQGLELYRGTYTRQCLEALCRELEARTWPDSRQSGNDLYLGYRPIDSRTQASSGPTMRTPEPTAHCRTEQQWGLSPMQVTRASSGRRAGDMAILAGCRQ